MARNPRRRRHRTRSHGFKRMTSAEKKARIMKRLKIAAVALTVLTLMSVSGVAGAVIASRNQLPATFAFYHGRQGISGFVGAITCKLVSFDKKTRFYKGHRCGRFVKPNS